MADLIGQQFGNYRLTTLLGSGGFAEVYLGEHVRLGMQAAIKILHTHLAGDEVAAFQKEAQTIAELIHPHIIRVLDFDLRNGIPFLVLDYAPKGSLRQRHKRGERLELAQVVSYVDQVASALQHAHDRKHVHRDVKPANMLVGRHDEILLTDFGIAAIAHSTSSMSPERPLGTLAYMSPEQIQGYVRPASDQYALAVTVYQWLSGVMPFRGSSVGIINQHLRRTPPSLRRIVPALSPGVEEVVMTALAKDHSQRFSSIQAFATAFSQASQEKVSQIRLDTAITVEVPKKVSQTLSYRATIVEETKKEAHAAKTEASGARSNGEKRMALEGRDGLTKVWNVGKHQVWQIVLGAALYALLSRVSTTFSLPFSTIFFLRSFRIFPAIVIPAFFGVLFGSLVGFFTGFSGYILEHYLFGVSLKWGDNLGNAIVGLIAGMTPVLTKRRNIRASTLLLAELLSVLGMLVGVSISVSGGGYATAEKAWKAWFFAALPNVALSLLLVPILFLVSHAVASALKRGGN